MSRRRRRRRRPDKKRRRRRPSADLERVLSKVDDLIARGRTGEAIEMLEPYLTSHPRSAEVHYYIGYARANAGNLWGALNGYERAHELSRDPIYWLPLASLYLDLGLRAHALRAFRQMFHHQDQVAVPMMDAARKEVATLEQDVMETADDVDLPVAQMEEGFLHLEKGQRALQDGDYAACIDINRQAIDLLGDWPPPRNNLSLALFFDGQPEEAVAEARQVLSHAPENLQALSNAIRFLAWAGEESQARKLWATLREVTPRGEDAGVKKAEAAATLGEDESVYELLKPLDKGGPERGGTPGGAWRTQLFLAVAEANTGRRRAAQRRLKMLQNDVPWANDLLTALRAGRPGSGWTERYPYFHSTELMPRQALGSFVELTSRQGEMPARQFRREVDRFVAGYPQIVRAAEKLIWEENQPDAGMAMLEIAGTPAAYAALRRFGLSQAGDDQTRLQALFKLAQAGQIPADETLRVWSEGEWREVQLRQYEITEDPEVFYTPGTADLLNRGQEAFQQNEYETAERLFQRALDLEPRAKEAYNSLAALYAHRGDHERAKKMYREAMDVDPTYVFPRGNLAMHLLDEGDIEGAEALLAPLADAERFQPRELAFYHYVQARLATSKGEYKAARRSLEFALEVAPGYGPAESLLDHLDDISERLDLVSRLRTGWESTLEQSHKRDQAKRERLQAELATPDPSLSETLPLHIKNALTGMGRVVMPWGGWTTLRKAKLIAEITAALEDRDNLERIVADLTDDERAALRRVLERGGSMSWQDFDARYDNDLEESRYWDWHEPETVMGRLRLRGLLAEATVDDELLIVVPAEVRRPLREILGA